MFVVLLSGDIYCPLPFFHSINLADWLWVGRLIEWEKGRGEVPFVQYLWICSMNNCFVCLFVCASVLFIVLIPGDTYFPFPFFHSTDLADCLMSWKVDWVGKRKRWSSLCTKSVNMQCKYAVQFYHALFIYPLNNNFWIKRVNEKGYLQGM